MMRSLKFFIGLIVLNIILITSTEARSPFEVQSGQLYNQEPSGAALDNPHKGPFSIQDSYVYLRINWRGYQAGINYRYDWIAPNGKVASSYTNKRKSNSNGGSWARISSQKLFENGPGRWSVRFYYNNQLKHSQSFAFQDPGKFTHLMYAPDYGNLEAGVIVAVHSSSYNPVEYFHFFKPLAVKNHMVLVAPYFPKKDFKYQTVFIRQSRADLHLQKILNEVKMKTGANTDRLFMYGQSAGGQFVHRYLMAYPEKIARMVVSAPGWWTFPNEKISYPYGVAAGSHLPGDIHFNLKKALEVPVLVVVGEKDILRTANVNQSRRADAQGRNRLERALHWMNSMSQTALDLNSDFNYSFHLAKDAKHGNVRGKTRELVFDFLTNKKPSNQQIAWSMQWADEAQNPFTHTISRPGSLIVQIRSEARPRSIRLGGSLEELKLQTSTDWVQQKSGYRTIIKLSPDSNSSMLYGQIELDDGSLSNLQGILW